MEKFENALNLCKKRSKRGAGMGAISIISCPYDGDKWLAEANWSDNSRIVGKRSLSVEEALDSLIELLQKE